MISIVPILIVEGKSDKTFLKSFLSADILMTDGTNLSSEFFSYLELLSEVRTILIFTDPDGPGLQIAQRIQRRIPAALYLTTNKKDSIKHHKVGIAECSKEEIIRVLTPFMGERVINQIPELEGLTYHSLEIKKIVNKYHVGSGTLKGIKEKLSFLKLDAKDIEEVIHE